MSVTTITHTAAKGEIRHRDRGRQILTTALERFGLPILLGGVVIYFSLTQLETFPTVGNAQAILSTQSVLAMLAIGGIVPFVAGQFDLSLAAVLGLTHVVAASLMMNGHSLGVATAAALLVGAAIGLVNGLVVSRLGVNSIITTLGTASLVQGGTTYVSDGATIATGLSQGLLEFGYQNFLGVPRITYLVALVALAVGYLLMHTPLGRSLEAVGTNRHAAKLVGLPEARLTVYAFVISGTVAGLAGIAQIAASGSASPTFGPNLLLPLLTAIFLGATTIRPGHYSVTGTLLAVAFLACSLSGLALAGAPSFVEPMYNGAALILAVAISTVVRRRRSGA